MFKFKQSRSILCKIFFEDINNFCLFNPFRFSRGLLFLFSKYYNLYRLNFHKQSKIFYKRLLYKKNKFRYKKYFKKIRLIKRKFLLFFNFRTFKQLKYLFNSIYFYKSIFLLNSLLYFLEFRLDFFLYRLRTVLSIGDARNFIQQHGLIVQDNQIIFDYSFTIQSGQIVTLPFYCRLDAYIKFYYFWFNNFVYANKLLNFNLINKIIILKKIKKKINFFFKILKKKLIFFPKNIINFFFKDKLFLYENINRFLLQIKEKIIKFVSNKKIFFQKISYCLKFYLVFYILFVFFQFFLNSVLNLNLVNLNIFSNRIVLSLGGFDSKNIIVNLKKIGLLQLLFFFIEPIKFKVMHLKMIYLRKRRISNYFSIINRRLVSKFSIAMLNKKKIIKAIQLLRQLVLNGQSLTMLTRLYRVELNFRLKILYKLFKRKFRTFFYRLKRVDSKRTRYLRYKIFKIKMSLLKTKRLKRLFRAFRYIYKAFNRVYKSFFFKRSKKRFFSFYRRVTKGFKFSFVHNAKAFHEKLLRPKRLFSFFKFNFINKLNSSSFVILNKFQYFFQIIFLKLKTLFRKSKPLWSKRLFKLKFLKYFILNKKTDFYNYLYRINKKIKKFNYFKFLNQSVFVKLSFFLLKRSVKKKISMHSDLLKGGEVKVWILDFKFILIEDFLNFLIQHFYSNQMRFKFRWYFKKRLKRFALQKINLNPLYLKKTIFSKKLKYSNLFRLRKFKQYYSKFLDFKSKNKYKYTQNKRSGLKLNFTKKKYK